MTTDSSDPRPPPRPKPKRWADPDLPLEERLVAAEIEVANRDTGEGRRAVMRELVLGHRYR